MRACALSRPGTGVLSLGELFDHLAGERRKITRLARRDDAAIDDEDDPDS
jgi:hypothetical protein